MRNAALRHDRLTVGRHAIDCREVERGVWLLSSTRPMGQLCSAFVCDTRHALMPGDDMAAARQAV